MSKITLDEFCNQWVRGSWTTVMASRLEKNVLDFTLQAGAYSKAQFQSSFSSSGFCDSGTWAPRTSRWGKKFTHPVLNDTGMLADSFQGASDKIDIVGRDSHRRRIFRKGARYSIWTTERSVPIKGKRGKNRERYGHYAAIHNTDPKFGLFTVNQYSSRRPVHRQFIGLSPKIDDYINAHFTDMIFEGFPR